MRRAATSIRVRITAGATALFVVGFAGVLTVVFLRTSSVVQSSATRYAAELAGRDSAPVQDFVAEALATGQDIARSMGELQQAGVTDRSV
jgi:hypothetical protein